MHKIQTHIKVYRSTKGHVRVTMPKQADNNETLRLAFGDNVQVTQESADLWIADNVTEQQFEHAVRMLSVSRTYADPMLVVCDEDESNRNISATELPVYVVCRESYANGERVTMVMS